MPIDPTPTTAPPVPRIVNLALQGGGSHGAFTWGVLDALLADGRIAIEGLSGASAGALNAVAMASGFAASQASAHSPEARSAARASLRRMWEAVVRAGSLGDFAQSLSKMLFGNWPTEQVSANFFGNAMSQWMSPYQSNPLDINPLRKLLDEQIDFKALARLSLPKVFVSATHVKTGRAEVFTGKRLTSQAVLASACLPMLFQAVEIDGEHYWDGGYSGNPTLSPLINACDSRDIVLVQINPLIRAQTPQTPQDIMDRVNELTFNASLLAQMRTIDFINRLLADGRLQEGEKYRSVRLHRIDGGETMDSLPASSKMSTDGAMIEKLFDLGHQATNRWLGRHFDALGKESTVNIRRDYVGNMPAGF